MKERMLKCLCVMVVLLLCASSAFAAKKSKEPEVSRPDVWILDLADGSPSNSVANFWHDDNSGDSGYSFLLDYTANTAFSLPRKGEKVRVTGKIISQVDMPYVAAYFNDDSKGWKSLSWTELLATDLKAGVPVEIDKEIEIQDDSNGKFRIELQYDLCWGDYAEIPKLNKAVGFSFMRSNESTDSYKFKTIDAEKWVIDYCDSDADSDGTFRKERESPLYTFDRKFDSLFLGVFPRKGDFIEVNIRGLSDTDIPHLNIQLVDNSEVVNWWQDISTSYWPSITNIKAGVPFSAKLLFPVDNPPKGDVMVRFHYDGEWEKEWRTTPDVGKAAKFTFERTTSSFDRNEMCEKIGVKNPPKAYYLDFADSNLGSTFEINWDDAEWAKCYRANLSFRNLIRGDMPKRGDYIVYSFNFTTSTDIPYLSFQLYDGSKVNSWNQPYTNDYMDFYNVRAGVPVKGKLITSLKDNPIFDANVQFIYDASWQNENHPSAGQPAVVSVKRMNESTNTLSARAPKKYKVDASKLGKKLNIRSFDENFEETKDPAKIKYYSADIDITSLFKKGDFPRSGDTVELTYSGAVNDDFTGIAFYLWETNDYIWWKNIGVNLDSAEKLVFDDLNITSGKKFKYSEQLILFDDVDLSLGMSIVFTK